MRTLSRTGTYYIVYNYIVIRRSVK